MKYLTIFLALTLSFSSVQAAIYEIDSGTDEMTDNDSCSLREALTAAFSQSAVDNCPAGDADMNIITLTTAVGTYNFNSSEFLVSPGTVPYLTINSDANEANERPVINLGLNNRFLNWPDFVDEELDISGVTFFFGQDADDLGGGVIRLEGDLSADENTLARFDVRETTFLSNRSAGDGGAIHLSGEIQVTLSDSLFQGNTADAGAAIHYENNALSRNFKILNTTFTLNTSDVGQGALNIDWNTTDSPVNSFHPEVSIRGSSFTENTANGLGGVAGANVVVNNAIISIRNSKFLDNNGSGLWTQLLENTEAVRPFDRLDINSVEIKDSYLNTLGPGVFQMHVIRTGFDKAVGNAPPVRIKNLLIYQTGEAVAGGIRVVDDADLSFIGTTNSNAVFINDMTTVGHATAVVSFHPEDNAVRVFDSIFFDNNANTAGDSSVQFNNNLVDIDPLFENAYGTDYYPGINSPALDQSNTANQGFPSNQSGTDVLGHVRVVGAFKDLGAVERQQVNELTVTISGEGMVEFSDDAFAVCDQNTSPCIYDIPSELDIILSASGMVDAEDIVWRGHCQFTSIPSGQTSDCVAGFMNDEFNQIEVFFDDVIFKDGFD